VLSLSSTVCYYAYWNLYQCTSIRNVPSSLSLYNYKLSGVDEHNEPFSYKLAVRKAPDAWFFLAYDMTESIRGEEQLKRALFFSVLVFSALSLVLGWWSASKVMKPVSDLAARLPRTMPGFANVRQSRWLEEAVKHYTQTAEGLQITYDPALRDAFLAAFEGPPVDLWPLWDATAGLPVALIRGANSDLLSAEAAAEMRRRRPDMIFAEVPGRAHVPFLDEPESLQVIRAFLERPGA
jgi:pimeloyl-ACP methyl ester carboxylesterase